MATPWRRRGVPHARVERVDVVRLGARPGSASATSAQRGSPPIAAMSERLTAIAFQPMSVEGGRRAAEVHVLHDEVGRREQDGITRHVQHGGVVADPGPDACSERAAGLAQPADQSELAELLGPYASGTCLDGTSSTEADERSGGGLGGSESPIMRCGAAPYSPGAGRSPGQTFASIFFLIWALGTAPMTWSTTSPLLDEEDGGDGADAVARGEGGVLIDVHLREAHLAGRFARELVEGRGRWLDRVRTTRPRSPPSAAPRCLPISASNVSSVKCNVVSAMDVVSPSARWISSSETA